MSASSPCPRTGRAYRPCSRKMSSAWYSKEEEQRTEKPRKPRRYAARATAHETKQKLQTTKRGIPRGCMNSSCMNSSCINSSKGPRASVPRPADGQQQGRRASALQARHWHARLQQSTTSRLRYRYLKTTSLLSHLGTCIALFVDTDRLHRERNSWYAL